MRVFQASVEETHELLYGGVRGLVPREREGVPGAFAIHGFQSADVTERSAAGRTFEGTWQPPTLKRGEEVP